MDPHGRSSPDPGVGEKFTRVIEAWQETSGSHARHEAELLSGGRHATALLLRATDRSTSSVVAKVRPRGELDLERAIHEVVLPQLGVETPRFLGFHAGDDGDVLFLEYVGSVEFLPFDPEHQAAAGTWLGTCHAASARASIPGLIPRRSLDDDRAELSATRSRLAATLESSVVGAEGAPLVARVLDLLERAAQHWPEWVERTATVPQVLTHGAFVSRNVRMRAEGRTLVTLPFDWDHAAVRSPAVDLARAWGRLRGFAANASLARYRAALAANGLPLDSSIVADIATLGTVIRAAAGIGWLIPSLTEDRLDHPLVDLDAYRQALEGVLRT